MIIESLIRLGRPFLAEGGLTSDEVIRHITDVTSPDARNFFQNVCIAEIGNNPGVSESSQFEVHPIASWGDWKPPEGREPASDQSVARKTKEIFVADPQYAVGIPFNLSVGGNPRARQGCYPIPAYPVYENSLHEMAGNEEEVFKFIKARAEFTIGWKVDEGELRDLSRAISKVLPKPVSGPSKTMAIIAVIDYRTGLYSHVPSGSGAVSDGSHAVLGKSRLYPGEIMVANLDRIVENIWEARLQEAAEKGALDDGVCSFCGRVGYTVSSYAKAWPLFSTTYSYPLPMELKETELVKSVGLCPSCYQALVFAATLLHKTEQTVDYAITKELFSPTQSVQGKEYARQSTKTGYLYGMFYALPVLDRFLDDPDRVSEFVAANMARLKPGNSNRDGFSLKDMLGFEVILAESIATESYRLTVMYYMGEWSRGAVDLIATIEDVVPSVAKQLTELCRKVGIEASEVAKRVSDGWNWTFGDNDAARYRDRHSSLLYNLILAYGSPYLWQSLDSVLHRRPLAVEPFVRNSAQRLQDQSKTIGDMSANRGFRDEIVFLLAFSEFLDMYHREIVGKGEVFSMSKWQEWISALRMSDPASWEPSSVAEVGFAAGTVIRTFARQYYRQTEKDFIKHRLMTFGADLKPHDIYAKGLARLQEYARKLDMHVSANLLNAAAAVSMSYIEMEEEIQKDRDTFIAAFWAGYQLCPPGLYPGATDSQDDFTREEKSEDERY